MALAWEALQVSGDPLGIGIVLGARSLPRTLLMVLGGAVSDRFSRRAVMIAADVVEGGAVGAAALLATMETLEIWHLAMVAGVAGAASAFFVPASTALVPELTTDELLLPANALVRTSRMFAAGLLGPAIGGIILASASSAWAFGLDAATFAVSVVSLLALSLGGKPATGHRAGLLYSVGEGFLFTFRERWLLLSLLVFAAVNFLAGAPLAPLLPALAENELGLSARGYGWLVAGYGAGGALSVLLATQVRLRRPRLAALYGSYLAGSLMVVGLAFADSFLLAAAAVFGIGFTLEWGNVLWTTITQTWVPRELLGRVTSLDAVFSLSLHPVAVAAAGAVASAVGVSVVLSGGGAIASVALLLVLAFSSTLEPRASGNATAA